VLFVGWELAGVLGDDDGVGGENDFVVVGEEVERGAVLVAGLVGWVEEDEVHGASVLDHGVEQLADAAVFDGVATLQLERGDVGADGERGFGLAFGKPDEVCAAAEGLDADGAGAGVEVGELGAFDTGREDVEERFAEAIAGGTGFEAFGGLEDSGAEFSGDDAH